MSNLTTDPTAPDGEQVLYAPLSDTHELLTAAAVSSSGQFIAVGTSAGVVGQYMKSSQRALEEFHLAGSDGMRSTQLFRVNEVSKYVGSIY